MSVQLYALTWDCSNALDQAKFWSAVLDKPVMDGATEEFAPSASRIPRTCARTGCSSRSPKARWPRTGSTRI